MRVIYFRGHVQQNKSVLITQVYKDYETVSQLWAGECAMRTLWNLYNLHAVRGLLNQQQQLILRSSMSGPHHYFGWLDPTLPFSITIENNTPVYQQPTPQPVYGATAFPESFVRCFPHFLWWPGKSLPSPLKKYINPRDPVSLVNTTTGTTSDSLFDLPGLLILPETHLQLPLLEKAYDLGRFRAKVIPNSGALFFDPTLVSHYKHAQHKLRIVTYYYGDRYFPDYIMPGSGIFIEHHEFIQAITPLNAECGGFVLLGHCGEQGLELLAVTVPFGYTLLVDVGCLHGDSTLTGLYAMAMTGNHEAMQTADTVFIKSKDTYTNVSITTTGKPSASQTSTLLLTSDQLSLPDLKSQNQRLQAQISANTPFWWQPVIMPVPGWVKTLESLQD